MLRSCVRQAIGSLKTCCQKSIQNFLYKGNSTDLFTTCDSVDFHVPKCLKCTEQVTYYIEDNNTCCKRNCLHNLSSNNDTLTHGRACILKLCFLNAPKPSQRTKGENRKCHFGDREYLSLWSNFHLLNEVTLGKQR